MRRLVAIAFILASAASALPIRHVHGTMTLLNDTVTLPVIVDDSFAECQLTGTWTGVVTWLSSSNGTSFANIPSWRERQGVIGTASNGGFFFRTGGLVAVQAKFTTATSGSVVVDCQPSTGAPPSAESTAPTTTAASTPTTYAMQATTVAQRPTNVATAPTGGNLTAATATQVYAGAAGICQVAVSNLSATIAMTCGQTSAVSLTVGLYVPPQGTYSTSQWYGGSVFCFPASGTPAYSTQVTSCP